MKFFLQKTFFVICFLITTIALAQNKIPINSQDYTNTQIEMADQFRADGKIYVVVAVVMLILVGIIVYLVLLDRKIENLRKLTENQPKL